MKKINGFLIRVLVLSSFVLYLYGCSNSSSSNPVISTPESNSSYTFSFIQTNIFNTSCALSGCHNSSSSQGGLNLSAGAAYNNLVNVQSSTHSQFKRVAPGSSANSVIIKLLNGSLQPKMPQNGSLSQSVIDSIAAWIDRGAPND